MARRIFLLFVSCAILPVLAFAFFSWRQVTGRLEQDARAELHGESRRAGMASLERLLLLDDRLRSAGSNPTDREAFTDEIRSAWTGEHRSRRFRAVGVLNGADPDSGPLQGLRPRTAEERYHLERGHALLRILDGAPGPSGRIFLVRGLPGGDLPSWLYAEVDPTYLWSQESLRFDETLEVTDGKGRRLFAAAAPDASPSGEADGRPFLQGEWQLFLRSEFLADAWTIRRSRDAEAVFEPAESFRSTFPLVVLLSLWVVVLLSATQIRRSLTPIEKLKEATRRVAGRDFDVSVEIETNDEFRDLGQAFNEMAGQIGHYIEVMTTVNAVGASLSAERDLQRLFGIVLEGAIRSTGATHGFLHRMDSEAVLGETPVSRGKRGEAAGPPPWAIALAEHSARERCTLRESEPLEGERLEVLTVPMADHAGAIVGVLQLLDLPEAGQAGEEVAVETRRVAESLASQAAVALQNVMHLEELQELNRDLEGKVRERTRALNRTLEELRETQTQLVHREKMASVGQLVAGIAHELNNPLAFIEGNLHFLREYTGSLAGTLRAYEEVAGAQAELRERFQEIRQEQDLDHALADLAAVFDGCTDGVQRSTSLVKDLRTFSRLDSADCMAVDLHQALDSTLNLLCGRLGAIEVVRDYADLPPVECLAGQLNQVLMNLITNAADAVGKEGRITVRTERVSEDAVALEVEDDGVGIPSEILGRIFDPFFTTKEVGEGTGLGLAISYGIVARHRGRLTVRSQPGQGSCFRVELPVEFVGKAAG